MDFQLILAGLIVAGAVFYLARSIYKSAKGNSCESSSCKCSPESMKKAKSI